MLNWVSRNYNSDLTTKVYVVSRTQCKNCGNLLPPLFRKNYVQSTLLLSNYTASHFHKNMSGESKFQVFPHCVEHNFHE